MRLTVETGPELDVASRAELERALAGLGTEGRGLAVLGTATAFMQVAARRPGAFVVEYRDPGQGRVFRAEGDRSLPQVLALLASYLETGEARALPARWREVAELRTRERGLSLDPGPRGDRTPRRMVALVVVGLALAALGLHLARRNLRFVERAARTDGTVVSLEVTHVSGSSRHTAYWPVVQYAAPGGAPMRFRGDRGSPAPEFRVGEKVLVLYDPERPDDARLAGPVSLWTAPLAAGVTGALLALAGGGALLLRRLRVTAGRSGRDRRRLAGEP